MKKWTVMLIPHDRGGTRTFSISNLHGWGLISVLVVLTFASTFFFQRHQAIQGQAQDLRRVNRSLELKSARLPEVTAPTNIDKAEARAIEERLRAEYEASLSAITAELNTLYDMEAKARDITGIAPRRERRAASNGEEESGKGGPAGDFGAVSLSGIDEPFRPPYVIYGLARPSADLVLQEIRLRTQSFSDLVADMEVEIDRIARVPSVWPLANGAGRITSRYGYRRDPFTRRVRHHDGTDISAPRGTRIRTTAKGTVVDSGYENEYGNVIRISHGNGMKTCYAHLSRRHVDVGEAVSRGDVIGTVGSTGRSTGPHLHYEVIVGGKTVNAEKYLTD